MPNMLCFCVFECAGMDIYEKDKNHDKKTKRTREMERVEKTRPGKQYAQKVKVNLQVSSNVKSYPWNDFTKMTEKVP